MKIYIGERVSCNLNYQYEYLYEQLASHFEIVNDPSLADSIVFPSSCCCTAYNLAYTLDHMNQVLEKKRKKQRSI